MADVSPTTAAPADPPVTEPASPPEARGDELDDLVEDVSIDGMCGVY